MNKIKVIIRLKTGGLTMREILFRGKRVDNGEWVYGFYFKATHHWHEYGVHEDWIAVDTIQNGGWCNVRGKYAVIPDTVGQYTGLNVNGTKIFEGDIVKDNYGDSSVIKYGRHDLSCCGCCFQSHDSMGFYLCSKQGYALSDEDVWDKFEIIGNIHDNPDLLGDK